MKKLPFGDKTFYLVEENEIAPLLEDIKKKEEREREKREQEEQKAAEEARKKMPFTLNGLNVVLHIPLPYRTCANWYDWLYDNAGIFYKKVPITMSDLSHIEQVMVRGLPDTTNSNYFRFEGAFEGVNLVRTRLFFDGAEATDVFLEEVKYLLSTFRKHSSRIKDTIRGRESFEKTFKSEQSLLDFFAQYYEQKRRR